MIESEAHCSLGINARRFLDFLMIEHMNHAGTENGTLFAPYNQLVKFGIPRSEIRTAIDDSVALGFADVVRGERLGGKPGASRYRLTWLQTGEGAPATNRWSQIKKEGVLNYRRERREHRAKKEKRKQVRKKNAEDTAKKPPHGAKILEVVREAALAKVRELEPAEQVTGSESGTGGVREVAPDSDFD